MHLFSVVDLCVSSISARCNQATVAFLRLLISTLVFSIIEVTCATEQSFSSTVFLLPPTDLQLRSEKMRAGHACQEWENSTIVEKDEAK